MARPTVACAAVNLEACKRNSGHRRGIQPRRRATVQATVKRPHRFCSISLQHPAFAYTSPLGIVEQTWVRSRGADMLHSSGGRSQAGSAAWGAMLPGSAGLMLRRHGSTAGSQHVTMCLSNFQRGLAALVAAAAVHSSQ
eukprot:scaffold16844_cov35-Prasinocladus_malaysianus.AAC.2